VVTLFSSGNIMVLLRAVTLHALHQLRRGCLSDLHYSDILLTTFIYHFKMNVSEFADDGHSKIGNSVQKSVWKDWQKTRNTQSVCMKCGRYSQCTPQEQKLGTFLLEKNCSWCEILFAFNTGNVDLYPGTSMHDSNLSYCVWLIPIIRSLLKRLKCYFVIYSVWKDKTGSN